MRRILPSLALVSALSLPAIAQNAVEPTYLETLLQDALSGEGRSVSIEGFDGAWSSSATIKNLRVADADGEWLLLSGLRLTWNRTALLRGRLEVEELSAQELVVLRAPLPTNAAPAPEAKGFSLPELPVSVSLDALKIERAEIGAALAGQDLVFSFTGSANLADGSGSTQLNLTRLDGPSGEFALEASYTNLSTQLDLALSLQEQAGGLISQKLGLPGQPSVGFDINGSGPIDNFSATLALVTSDQPRLTGAITLAPQSDGIPGFDAQLNGDLASLFAPDYQAFFGPEQRISATGYQPIAGGMVLDKFALSASAITLDGALEIAASGWPERIKLGGTIAAQNGAVVLPISGAKTEIQSAQIDIDYDATKGSHWQLNTGIIGLKRADISLGSVALTGQGNLIPKGAFGGKFYIDADQIHPADAKLATAIGPRVLGQVRADWAPDSPLTLSDLDLSAGTTGLKGQIVAQIGTDGAMVSFASDVQLALADLSRFAGLAQMPLTGAANVALKGTVAPLEGTFDLNLDGSTTDLSIGQAQLDPLLQGAGALALTLRRDTSGIFVDRLDVATDHATITGTATLKTGGSEAQLTAKLAQVELILPDLKGAANLRVDATQSGEIWQVKTEGTAPGDATLSADISVDPKGPIRGTVAAEIIQISAYGALVGRSLGGTAALNLSGQGDFVTQSFDGALKLNSRDLAAGLGDLDQLLAGDTAIDVKASRSASGEIHLQQAQLQGRELSGKISGNYAPSAPSDLLFDVKLRDMALLGTGISGALSAAGTARLTSGNWLLETALTGPGGTAFGVNGSVSETFKHADLSLNGTAPLALANPIIQPRTVSGIARADLRLKGPLSLAALSGSVTTSGARMANPDLRIALQEIDTTLRLANNSVSVNLGAQISSGGRITVNGPISLNPGFGADLRAELTDVKASDPSLYQTILNGAITVAGPLSGGARISGRLNLGETELRIPETSGPSFANLPGLKHRNEPAEVRRVRDWAGLIEAPASSRAGPSYPLDLTIAAPSRIFVRGRGLDAELGGVLRLSGDTKNVIPQGQFDLIRGRMDILGKRVTLSEARIQLQGAFDPFLRFVAVTETAGTTASITLEGRASAPKLSFSASPDLPEDEVLARILFGKGISTISPLQAVRLAAAIRTLSGKGGDGLTGKLRQGLALDDLDVTTSDSGATQAKAGKYISENIYTEVIADTAGKSQINLNLQINPSLTARGKLESDGNSGIGIFIEKDY